MFDKETLMQCIQYLDSMYYCNYLYELIKSIPQGVREPRLNKTFIKCTMFGFLIPWFDETLFNVLYLILKITT